MPELLLEGLVDETLAGWLGALGLFRAIATQRDEGATLRFRRDGVPVLASQLDRDALVEWVMSSWCPRPIASPWNKGAGFHGSSKSQRTIDGDKKDGVQLIASCDDPRLDDYRRVIDAGRQVVDALGAPTTKSKGAFIQALRAELPDVGLDWLDAAVVLAGGDTAFPSILGTGGNDGRLDLGNNLMLRLCALVPWQGNRLKRKRAADAHSREMLRAALFGERASGLDKESAGQLDPASRAAPNASSAGRKADKGGKISNPWHFVWALEGCLWFRGTATRRLGSQGRARAAVPFHVRPVHADYGTALEGEKGKDELWVPLWEQPARFAELWTVFGEARAQVGRRPAQTGLDFARALGDLGTARGLSTFRRYALLERAGQSNIAVPLGRYGAQRGRAVDLLDGIEGWVDRWRRVGRGDLTPPRYQVAWRQYERAAFALARTHRDPTVAIQDVLAALGRLERLRVAGTLDTLQRLPRLRLSDRRWLTLAWSDEPPVSLQIAAALGGLARSRNPAEGPLGGLRAYLVGAQRGGPRVRDAAALGLVPLLHAVLLQRLAEIEQAEGDSPAALGPAAGRGCCTMSALAEWIQQPALDERVVDLVWALQAATPRARVSVRAATRGVPPVLCGPWALARLALHGRLPSLHRGAGESDGPERPRYTRADLHPFIAAQAHRAGLLAHHRLRVAGWRPLPIGPTHARSDREASRLAAALVVPLHTAELATLASSTLHPTVYSSLQDPETSRA